jgi:serpin B
LVLVNALYLKAPWADLFEERATIDRPFYCSGVKAEAVPTMRETADLGYLKGDGFTAVILPYQGGKLQFLILLPDDRGGLGQLAMKLTPSLLSTCAGLPYSQLVSLFLPRFRLEGSSVALAESLKALGMITAFDVPPGSANFDRAAPRKPLDYLLISDVFHKAFIAIDEKGTEAAAATAVVMMVPAMVRQNPPVPIEIHVDHPFFFAIQERASGVCLFLGSVVDPK